MSLEMIPAAPRDEESRDTGEQSTSTRADGDCKQGRGSGSKKLPTREEIMQGLHALPGLVAMKLLTPPQANVIANVYRTLLAELARPAATQAATLTDDDALRILREQPTLLRYLEPILTDEQVSMLLRKEGGD